MQTASTHSTLLSSIDLRQLRACARFAEMLKGLPFTETITSASRAPQTYESASYGWVFKLSTVKRLILMGSSSLPESSSIKRVCDFGSWRWTAWYIGFNTGSFSFCSFEPVVGILLPTAKPIKHCTA